jgi:hypothetical protein
MRERRPLAATEVKGSMALHTLHDTGLNNNLKPEDLNISYSVWRPIRSVSPFSPARQIFAAGPGARQFFVTGASPIY